MKSTKSMNARKTLAGVLGVAMAALWLGLGPGCGALSKPPKLTPPAVTPAPYGTPAEPVLWAVVPLRNESGTTVADPLRMSDKVVAAISETPGLACLPVNRTLEAMRALEMTSVGSPAEAQVLARTLGADGIIAGSITAYDPYQPVLGLSLALFGTPGAMGAVEQKSLDAKRLTSSATEPAATGPGNFQQRPLSVISEHLDGKNHQVLVEVEAYAWGRSDPSSSLGWKRYVASMDLYEEFGAHHAVSSLIRLEWARIGGTPPGAGTKD